MKSVHLSAEPRCTSAESFSSVGAVGPGIAYVWAVRAGTMSGSLLNPQC